MSNEVEGTVRSSWTSIRTNTWLYPNGTIWLCEECGKKLSGATFEPEIRTAMMKGIYERAWDSEWNRRKVIMNYAQMGEEGVVYLVSGQQVAIVELRGDCSHGPPWVSESYYGIVIRLLEGVRSSLRTSDPDRERWFCAECDTKGNVNLGRGGVATKFMLITQKGEPIWEGKLWPEVVGRIRHPSYENKGMKENRTSLEESWQWTRSVEYYRTIVLMKDGQERMEGWRQEGYPIPLDLTQRQIEDWYKYTAQKGGDTEISSGDERCQQNCHKHFPWKRGICHAATTGSTPGWGPLGLETRRKGMCARNESWVIPCFTCHREYCEPEWLEDEMSTCAKCGWVTCSECNRPRGMHERHCPGEGFPMTIKTARGNEGRTIAEQMRNKAKNAMQCRVRTCKAKRDIGSMTDINHTCADCRGLPCVDGSCKTTLQTPNCKCFGTYDICKLCMIRAEDGWIGCRHCMKVKKDLWWMGCKHPDSPGMNIRTVGDREARQARRREGIMNPEMLTDIAEERSRAVELNARNMSRSERYRGNIIERVD